MGVDAGWEGSMGKKGSKRTEGTVDLGSKRCDIVGIIMSDKTWSTAVLLL